MMPNMQQQQSCFPLHPNASIFVRSQSTASSYLNQSLTWPSTHYLYSHCRRDEHRMDVFKAILSGPIGTPYFGEPVCILDPGPRVPHFVQLFVGQVGCLSSTSTFPTRTRKHHRLSTWRPLVEIRLVSSCPLTPPHLTSPHLTHTHSPTLTHSLNIRQRCASILICIRAEKSASRCLGPGMVCVKRKRSHSIEQSDEQTCGEYVRRWCQDGGMG
jgi:hypothetical protein